MNQIEFTSYDDLKLNCYLWDDCENPIGVVQIFHGMAEHALRYNDVAKFLNSHNIICFADDHRAHGLTSEELGYEKGDIYNATIKDEILITKYLREKYNLPIIILGHSYGSFLLQRYMEINSGKISGAILSGSSKMSVSSLSMGSTLARIIKKIKGPKNPAKFMNKLIFGTYNKRFKQDGSKNAWLSQDKEQVLLYDKDKLSGIVMSNNFFYSFLSGTKQVYKKGNLNGIRKDLPILIIGGQLDPISYKNGMNKLLKMYEKLNISNVRLVVYPNCRHEILNEINKNEVYEEILLSINNFIK